MMTFHLAAQAARTGHRSAYEPATVVFHVTVITSRVVSVIILNAHRLSRPPFYRVEMTLIRERKSTHRLGTRLTSDWCQYMRTYACCLLTSELIVQGVETYVQIQKGYYVRVTARSYIFSRCRHRQYVHVRTSGCYNGGLPGLCAFKLIADTTRDVITATSNTGKYPPIYIWRFSPYVIERGGILYLPRRSGD